MMMEFETSLEASTCAIAYRNESVSVTRSLLSVTVKVDSTTRSSNRSNARTARRLRATRGHVDRRSDLDLLLPGFRDVKRLMNRLLLAFSELLNNHLKLLTLYNENNRGRGGQI